VRLKGLHRVCDILITAIFQYQKGAIKTQETYRLSIQAVDFQYQKGAIKTIQMRPSSGDLRSTFNTKKVRLKLHLSTYRLQLPRHFQYQKGAIKTRRSRLSDGRLGALSIPKRCD